MAVGLPAFHMRRTTFTGDAAVTSVEVYIRGELAFEESVAPGHAEPPVSMSFRH